MNKTEQFYEEWKKHYLMRDEYVKGDPQYYVLYSGKKYQGGNKSVPVTVSEAVGYGMLIMAFMADYDAKAQNYFDGMVRFYKAHPSSAGPCLMSWQQSDNGSALIDGAYGKMIPGISGSASDGDLDIAYALLMADKIWGSSGEFDYRSDAIALINDIYKYEVNHEFYTVGLGDWVYTLRKDNKFYSAVRCSDFMPYYFKKFADVTGDENWLKVYDSTLNIVSQFLHSYHTGLLPDFAVRNAEGRYMPAPGRFLEGIHDGDYCYNSCRVPWRLSMGYLLDDGKEAEEYIQTVNRFILTAAKGNPARIRGGYKLDGTALVDYEELCFAAPFMAAAACGSDREWYEKLSDYVLKFRFSEYYGDNIKMLCLLMTSVKERREGKM